MMSKKVGIVYNRRGAEFGDMRKGKVKWLVIEGWLCGWTWVADPRDNSKKLFMIENWLKENLRMML